MRAKLILFLLLCVMGLGIAALTGCKDDKSSINPAAGALLLNSGQSATYFPVIPKGVAQ